MTDFNQAIKDKQKAVEKMKTCPLLFKCSPEYEEAIPYFKSAANGFKGARNHREEIYCREQLVICFQKTASLWEEGNEHEQIANIYFFELKDDKQGLKSITNAFQAYYNQGDYQSSTKAIQKIALNLRQEENIDTCEQVLKISFDSILKFGHLVVVKDDAPSDYIYKTFKLYFAVLIQNNKTRIAIENCDLLYKSLSSFEKDQSELFLIFFQKLLGMIINEEEIDENLIDECRKISEDREDQSRINCMIELIKAIKNGDEKAFNNNTYEVGSGLDNEVIKNLKKAFNKIKSDNKELDENQKKIEGNPTSYL